MAPADHDGAAAVWKTVGNEFVKNVEKQPGWVYVLAVAYLAVSLLRLPAELHVLGRPISVPNEVWAVFLGFAAYWIGDALDKITFKTRTTNATTGKRTWTQRYAPQSLLDARAHARRTLGVGSGIYDISMRLLDAAYDARFAVHFVNEFSKFLRSLIIPGALIAIVACFYKALTAYRNDVFCSCNHRGCRRGVPRLSSA